MGWVGGRGPAIAPCLRFRFCNKACKLCFVTFSFSQKRAHEHGSDPTACAIPQAPTAPVSVPAIIPNHTGTHRALCPVHGFAKIKALRKIVCLYVPNQTKPIAGTWANYVSLTDFRKTARTSRTGMLQLRPRAFQNAQGVPTATPEHSAPPRALPLQLTCLPQRLEASPCRPGAP